MTLDEAIRHCREVAKEYTRISTGFKGCSHEKLARKADECESCAAEHEQLAKWLEELQERRDWEQHNENGPGQAHWLHRKRNGYAVLVCSNCGKEKEGYTCTAYCPTCGRRMTEEATGCE